MHIAILAPSDKSIIAPFLSNYSIEEFPDGYFGAPFIATIIQEFLRLGHQITAITTSKAIAKDYTTKTFSNGRFTWVVVASRPKSFRFNGLKLGRIIDFYSLEKYKMVEILNQYKPDIVHAHWSYEFAGAAINAKFPYLITVHDNAYQILKYFKNIYRFSRLLMSEYNFFNIHYASTVSPYMLNYVKKRCDNVAVIPNPISVLLNDHEIDLLIKDKLRSLKNPSIIMINNGWDSRKNGKNGLIAFNQLLSKFPNAKLNLYGGGTEMYGLAYKDALKLGLTNITFNGPVSHLSLINALKNSHILLHPSLEESFGVVLIEAMSFGIPTIGGKDSGAVPWVINNDELLVDVSNTNCMFNKIVDMLSDNNLYAHLANSSYRNVVQRFSADKVVELYLKYYHQIIFNI